MVLWNMILNSDPAIEQYTTYRLPSVSHITFVYTQSNNITSGSIISGDALSSLEK